MHHSYPVVAEATAVSDESRVKSLVARVKARFGKAHVLINCAAIMTPGLIGDVLIASWWSGYVRISQAKAKEIAVSIISHAPLTSFE